MVDVLDGQGDVFGGMKYTSEGLEDLTDCMGNVLGGEQDAVGGVEEVFGGKGKAPPG